MKYPAWTTLLALAALCACGDPAAKTTSAAAAGDTAGPDASGLDAEAPDDGLAGYDGEGDAGDEADAPADETSADPLDGATDATATSLDAGAVSDAPAPEAGATDGGMFDAGASSAGDASDAADAGACLADKPFDYKCSVGKPTTCPGGLCLLGLCVGPKLDEHRWDSCGSGFCDPCEKESGTCPADCGPDPVFTGTQQYGGGKTITVWVHGFSNQGKDKLQKLTYGDPKGCGDLLGQLAKWTGRPCGDTPQGQKDPTHLIGVEYYGSKPPAWMTPQDVAEVEKFPYSGGPEGLQRYATIVSKFVEHQMAVSGATHVNLACHSMGCLITRHLIENDYAKLASSRKIVRWFTTTGVIDGAALSRLFDNPAIQQGATALGLELSDFILMNPDYVWDVTSAWDHQLFAANSPLLGGVLIHHVGASEPKIKQALGIQLLDLDNPTDEPNDGIMLTRDEYFHDQKESNRFATKSGEKIKPTVSLVHADHMNAPSTDAAAVTALGALFHKRKAWIRLKSIQLVQDRESHKPFDGEFGAPPAEIAVESEIRFNPYVKATLGVDVLVHEDKVDYRTPKLATGKQGETIATDLSVFEGPVLDGMTELRADIVVQEVDWFPHWQIAEWLLDKMRPLAEFHGQVALTDGATFTAKSQYAICTFEVRVLDLY